MKKHIALVISLAATFGWAASWTGRMGASADSKVALQAPAPSTDAATEDKQSGRGLMGFLRNRFPGPAATEIGKNHELVRIAFRDVVARANRATVRLFVDGELVALGTVVDSDGLILTKASQIPRRPVCRLWNGPELSAAVVHVDATHDLALLRVDARNLTPVQFQQNAEVPLGTLVASPGGFGDKPISIGVVGVAARTIPRHSGILGVRLDPAASGARVSLVLPGSGAAKAGLRPDDIILHVNGQPVATPKALVDTVQQHRPGETIRLLIERQQQQLDLVVTLSRITDLAEAQSELPQPMGSGLSERRSDFPSVIQHDTVLRPNECGGPVVDVEGNVVGINIARASRVATYAIPADVVREVVEQMITSQAVSQDAQGVNR
jgi:serine protease Do